jgi:hypothetical protein
MQTLPRPDGPSEHVYRKAPAMIGQYGVWVLGGEVQHICCLVARTHENASPPPAMNREAGYVPAYDTSFTRGFRVLQLWTEPPTHVGKHQQVNGELLWGSWQNCLCS